MNIFRLKSEKNDIWYFCNYKYWHINNYFRNLNNGSPSGATRSLATEIERVYYNLDELFK